MQLTEICARGKAFFTDKPFTGLLDYVETGFISRIDASLVGLRRPILYGLVADGSDGVAALVSGITRELQRLMIMVGALQPDAFRREILVDS